MDAANSEGRCPELSLTLALTMTFDLFSSKMAHRLRYGYGYLLLVINCNLGPTSHRFRDMATFRLKSLPPTAVQPFKVIGLGLNGKPMGDFILVINCNLGPISHRFRDMATFRSKSLPPWAVQPFKVIQGHRS